MFNVRNVLFTFVLIAGLMSSVAYLRLQDFQQSTTQIAEQSVRSGSSEVARVVAELRRRIALFAEERRELLLALARFPNDAVLYHRLSTDLKRHFPSFFAVTLSSPQGNAMLQGLDQLVGNGCRTDIREFSGHVEDHGVYVHGSPQNNPHHFDVMVPFTLADGEEGVFFVSFYARMLAKILQSVELPGHHLYLTVQKHRDASEHKADERPGIDHDWFIEVSSVGARDALSRDLMLTAVERESTLASAAASGTRWLLIDVPAPALFSKQTQKVVTESLGFGLVLFVLSLLVLHKSSRVEAMAQQRREMERASRSKAEFISTINHEFRTPMNAVINMNKLALSADSTQTAKSHIEKSLSSANHMMRMLDQTLDFSSMDAGRLELAVEEFEFLQWLHDSTQHTALKAAQKGLSFELQPASNIDPWLLGDNKRLGQIIDLLGDNAVKFTPTGGEVRIAVELSNVWVSALELHFTISDTGVGIKPEDQARLFTAIGQVDGSDTREYGGMGLGLVLCRGLVELMEGELWGESQYGHGSVFHFTARLEKSERQVSELMAVDPSPTQRIPLDASGAEEIASETIDLSLVQPLLDQLGALIEDYDADADSVAGQLKEVLPASYLARNQAICDAVSVYNFDLAAELLNSLSRQIKADAGVE